ncbi:MAG: hypothetical protein F4Z31_01750 [Gemmatimonadetes bacterium]|nr:hypothetical protein [Gemmatimonadota bacterium]
MSIDSRPRRGNLGTGESGQCRIVWTSDRLDNIKVGTAILVQVNGMDKIVPCYVIAKLPQRRDNQGRTHQAVARCGIIESPPSPGDRAGPSESSTTSQPQPQTEGEPNVV